MRIYYNHPVVGHRVPLFKGDPVYRAPMIPDIPEWPHRDLTLINLSVFSDGVIWLDDAKTPTTFDAVEQLIYEHALTNGAAHGDILHIGDLPPLRVVTALSNQVHNTARTLVDWVVGDNLNPVDSPDLDGVPANTTTSAMHDGDSFELISGPILYFPNPENACVTYLCKGVSSAVKGVYMLDMPPHSILSDETYSKKEIKGMFDRGILTTKIPHQEIFHLIIPGLGCYFVQANPHEF